MATSQTKSQTSQIGTGTEPSDAKAAVFVASAPLPDDALPIIGPDLSILSASSSSESNVSSKFAGIGDFLASYKQIGFQATSLAKAIEIVQNMVSNFD
jgi:deoxyhypusine synthase